MSYVLTTKLIKYKYASYSQFVPSSTLYKYRTNDYENDKREDGGQYLVAFTYTFSFLDTDLCPGF